MLTFEKLSHLEWIACMNKPLAALLRWIALEEWLQKNI
jgi:hypothetical protein